MAERVATAPGDSPATDPLETGSHDLPVSSELEAFLCGGWGALPSPTVRPLAPPERCARRRRRLSQALPGERLVVPAGAGAHRGNGQEVRFRAASDHVYLTGGQSAGAVLVLEPDGDGHEATLYVDPPSGRDGLAFYNDTAHGELWVGARPTLEDVEFALGLACKPLGELASHLAAAGPTRVVRGADPALDATVVAGDPFADRELLAILSELRLVKDEWEIEQIERAVGATIRGFEDVGRALARASSEREIETAFATRARLDGNDVAFNPIAAAGAHATTLHWTRNDGVLRHGDLLLLDAGVESESLYAADITRTYPASGTFTATQRRVVELLNHAHEAALAAVGPGRSYRDFRYAIAAVMSAGLADWGIVPSDGDDVGYYRRFTICGPGHMLGLDVHDCGNARAAAYLDGVLEPGHVLTVEPGLYFQANDLTIPEELRGIGVRVEDDVVVTGDGHRNLSASLPRRAAEIETWLASLSDA